MGVAVCWKDVILIGALIALLNRRGGMRFSKKALIRDQSKGQVPMGASSKILFTLTYERSAA